jgi:hypothetical protein
MSNSQIPAKEQRSMLLTEIAQTPDDRIPELLKITRLLRQSVVIDLAPTNTLNQAMEQIDRAEMGNTNRENIQKLFQEWAELDEEEEQKQILKIIESIEGVSI